MKRAASPSLAAQDFATLDRRITWAFGLLLLCLMAVVLLAGGWYLRSLMERENNRLASITTQVLADAVSRVGFAGKHQVRQLVEEIPQRHPGLAYARLIGTDGLVQAHSDAQFNDSPADEASRTLAQALLAAAPGTLHTRSLALPGDAWVRETSTVFRGGFGNEVQGVLQVGIWDTAYEAAWRSGAWYLLALLGALAALGLAATWRISRYFGLPVRQLALQAAHERLRLASTIEAMQAGTWEWNVQTHEVLLSERWADIVGYSLEELAPIGEQTFVRLSHPDDVERNRQLVMEHLAGRSASYSCESRMRHKDGHWVWVLNSGRITERDAQGQPLKMMGARQDISARKAAEAALLQEGERFAALARVSNTGVWEWDEARQYLWCSPEYFSMLGRSSADYPEHKEHNLDGVWVQLLHPDDREPAARKFADYLAAGAPGMYENEFRMAHANGSWVWIWSRGSALRGADGSRTGKTMGTHIDITSIKQAQAQLRESQERIERISNNLPSSMVFQLECGPEPSMRRMHYVSQGVHAMHGVTVQEVLHDVFVLYRQVPEEDRLRLQNSESQSMARLSDFKAEIRCILPGGGLRWFEIISSPRQLPNGHVVFDGIEVDITERKQREQQIEELNTHLEQRVVERTAELSTALEHLQHTQQELLQNEKLASLGALVAGMAHELNTPIGNALTIITTLIRTHQRFKAAVEAGLTRSALAEYLQDTHDGGQIIERNLARAAELIGSFKQLAADQASSQRRRFALREVAQEVALALAPTLRKTPFALHIDVPEDLQLDSYPGPLGQVLMNLINNAVVHAFEGRALGNITVAAQADGPGWLELVVQDDGSGIAPEQQTKVFDPFYTTKLGQGGSGLGLHIVHTMVTGLLGGRIALHSEVGQGSRFVLLLPTVAPVAGAAALAQ